MKLKLLVRTTHVGQSWGGAVLFAFSAAVAAAGTVPVTTGLVLHLHNDAGVTANGSNLVSAWADQSGTGNDVAQPDAGKQPLLVTGVTNGSKTFNVLRFDGVDDVLTRKASDSVSVTGLPSNLMPGGTVFIVSRTSNRNLSGGQVSLAYGKDNNNRFTTGYSATTLNTRWRSGGGGTTANSSIAPVNDTFYVEAASWDGPGAGALSLDILKPDSTVSTTTTTVQSTTNFSDSMLPMELDLGAMGTLATGAGTTFVGDIAEALIYNGSLSASDRTAVINYLGAKYGVIAAAVPEPTTWMIGLIACSIFAFSTRSFLNNPC